MAIKSLIVEYLAGKIKDTLTVEEVDPNRVTGLIFIDMDECFYYNMDGLADNVNRVGLSMLRDIAMESGFKIVLCSIWGMAYVDGPKVHKRAACQLLDVMNLRDDYGLPLYNAKHPVVRSPADWRGNGVREYMSKNGYEDLPYIIIDDSNDFYPEQLECLVKVDPVNGFVIRDADKARVLLGLDSLSGSDPDYIPPPFKFAGEESFKGVWSKDSAYFKDEVFSVGPKCMIALKKIEPGEKLTIGINVELKR